MSFRRYESYRDSGVEWLGEVPSHWELIPLKRDISFLTSGSRGWADLYSDDGALFIRIGNLTRHATCLDLADIQRVAVPAGSEGERTKVREGDVLFSITAYLGSVAVVPAGLETAYVSQHVALARLGGKRLLPAWAAFVALSVVGKSYLASQGYGGTKVQLSLDDIACMPMTAPPLSEQQVLVAFLERETAKIDSLVGAQRRLIELLKEKRQAVISHAVTKGLDPSAPTKDSGVEWLGAVPEHWEICRIANLFGESVALLSEDLPILSVSIHSGVSDEELDEDDLERKVSRSEDRGKYKRVRPGDLVYNMMRAWQGGFGTVSVDGGVSPAYVVARPKVDIETAFVEWVLRTPQCVEEMRTRSVGVTDFRLRLYWDEFKDLKIALPPLAEQRRILTEIGAEIERYRKLAEAAEAAVTLLSERRAALISAAVTGKIDVRGWTAAEVRTAVAAEIIRLHARKPTFGRVKNQKLLYLAEAHAGITEIGGRYERKAAGPYDADLIALVERDLAAAGVMTVSQPDGTGSAVSYSLNRSWKPDTERLKAMLGDRLAPFEQVNAKLADLKTRDAEAVATLYAVWNDALIDGEACDDARLIRGFLDEWHPEKREKFKEAELYTWLGWMRRNGLVPGGSGPRTGTGGLFT